MPRTLARRTRRPRPRAGKARRAAEARVLTDIPNIGPSIAGDLRRLGITQPRQLAGRDPIALYRRMNRLAGHQDPCLADAFIAAVRFMQGGPAKPWWAFTPERKRMLRPGRR